MEILREPPGTNFNSAMDQRPTHTRAHARTDGRTRIKVDADDDDSAAGVSKKEQIVARRHGHFLASDWLHNTFGGWSKIMSAKVV